VTSHIPDKGQVTVRYYGQYANAHIYRSSETDVRGGEAPALQYSWSNVSGSMSAALQSSWLP